MKKKIERLLFLTIHRFPFTIRRINPEWLDERGETLWHMAVSMDYTNAPSLTSKIILDLEDKIKHETDADKITHYQELIEYLHTLLLKYASDIQADISLWEALYEQVVKEQTKKSVLEIFKDLLSRADKLSDTEFQKELGKIYTKLLSLQAVSNDNLISKTPPDKEEVIRMIIQPIGLALPTPIPKLNKALRGGFPRGDIITLGALTGSGKTIFAMQSAWEIQSKGVPVIYFALEFSWADVLRRLLPLTNMSITSDMLTATYLRDPEHQERIMTEFQNLINTLEQSNVWFSAGKNGITPREVEEAVHMVIDETGDKPFVVIDNLDNLKPIKQTNNPVRDIDNTMEYLRSITVSTGATMLVLSQLNKEAMRENRTDLVAFRGSGSINHYSAVALGMKKDGEIMVNGETLPVYVFEIQKKRWGSTTDSVSAVLDYKNLCFLEYEIGKEIKEKQDL